MKKSSFGFLVLFLFLAIDAVWLNPICASPNKDNGYDISDYENIHPLL